jgi:hypothetical protein
MDLPMPMCQKLEEQPLHAIRSDMKGEEMQYIQRYCYYFGSCAFTNRDRYHRLVSIDPMEVVCLGLIFLWQTS